MIIKKLSIYDHMVGISSMGCLIFGLLYGNIAYIIVGIGISIGQFGYLRNFKKYTWPVIVMRAVKKSVNVWNEQYPNLSLNGAVDEYMAIFKPELINQLHLGTVLDSQTIITITDDYYKILSEELKKT